MKTTLILLFVLLVVRPAEAQQDSTYRIPAQAGQTLKMELSSGGSVNIYTWPEPWVEARIRIVKCQGGACEASLEATSYGGLLKSQISHQKGSTSISIRIDVWLPNDFDVEITSAGGAINATGLNGSLTGRCGGGHLKVNDMTGKIAFSTGGGGITIERGALDASLSTGGGSIEVKNAAMRGRLSTGAGSIKVTGLSILSREDTGASDGLLSMNTGAGNIRIALAHNADPEIMDLQLNTGSGKVSIELPGSMDPSVDIEMAYTRNFPRQEITSDVALETQETQQWDDKKGTPRRYIYARSINGNTRQNITIRNINGDIVIRKF